MEDYVVYVMRFRIGGAILSGFSAEQRLVLGYHW